jgi:hypothetical protein
MFKKIEKPAACEMRAVIRFLNVRNMKPADIYRQLCEAYREHAMSETMVPGWVIHFTEGRENVHDDPRGGRSPVVNEDLVRAVEEKFQENRRFTISSLSLRTVFWDRKCVLLVEFLPQGSTVNAGVYCDTLKKLRRAIQNKRRGMLSRGVVMLPDNARPHTATSGDPEQATWHA